LIAGKWIPDLTATIPLEEAALRALQARLGTVREKLEKVLGRDTEDPEVIHQLRVGTRRTGAVLSVFSGCLPTRIRQKARKRLRGLRQAAGEVRDWDVFLMDLAQEVRRNPRAKRAGLDFLTGFALGQRQAAQAGLQEGNRHFPQSIDRLINKMVEAVRPPEDGPNTLIELARSMLIGLVNAMDEAATRDLKDYDNLHQVRIAGKRLRYAMEIFAYCYPPALREVHYLAVEEVQDILGLANDSHVAGRRLQALAEMVRAFNPAAWRRYGAQIEGLRNMHEQRLPELRHRFEAWWHRWRQEGGEAGFCAMVHGDGPVRQR
jgi:CHAD domain-containing protein